MKKISKKIAMAAVLMGVMLVSAVGCSNGSSSKEVAEPASSANVQAEAPKEVKITHELGEVVLKETPKKVVVFDYGILDGLNKMEVEIAALPKATLPVALDKYKDAKYVDVGTLKEANFEKIYEINPDLIIISGRQKEQYAEFSKIAPTVFMQLDDKDYIGSVKKNMNLLGEIFNKKDVVEKELTSIENSIKTLNEKVAATRKNALILLANDGALSAYGKVSRFGIIHNSFGFKPADENIQVSTHGQSVSFEYVVEKNPDYIFVIDRAAVTGGSTTASKALDNELIKTTEAYKNNRIIYLDPATWYVGGGGFNSTIKMISEVEAAIK